MFSILICSYNKARTLRAVLTNLNRWAHRQHRPFEVVVIIDGSTDDTIQMIEDIRPGYTLRYFYIGHSGLSEARNAGIRQCRGEYVVFCDDDVLLHPDYLERLYLSVERHPTKVHIGNLMNIGKEWSRGIIDDLIDQGTTEHETFVHMQEPHIFFDASKKLFHFQDNYEEFNPASWWAVVTGGNLCIPRRFFEAYGYFDGNIKGWGPEDADLCYRFFKHGVKAVWNRDCLLYHLDHPRNADALLESMTRNAVYFIKKYRKPRELYAYLNFTNGKISLKEFNDLCSELFDMEKVDVPSFSMSMKDYSGKEQFLKL
ncbi:MAG TPA: glycosyltransferase family 2 protein [Puia sp.]|nr:glycosyltransferase family 2 protein [Puia sp.]